MSSSFEAVALWPPVCLADPRVSVPEMTRCGRSGRVPSVQLLWFALLTFLELQKIILAEGHCWPLSGMAYVNKT